MVIVGLCNMVPKVTPGPCDRDCVVKMMKGLSEINSYSIILKLFEARVGLARAIYSDAEVYLLDDPLAAVDSKVSKKIQKFHFNPTAAYITTSSHCTAQLVIDPS